MAARARRAALAVLVIVAALAGADLAAARFLVAPSGDYPRGLFREDSTRGLALTPGFRGEAVRAGHRFGIEVNEAGWRDAPWETPAPGRPTLLLLGSSATFGVGLAPRESVAGQLAALLEGRAVVRNTGVYSWGPPQMLATLAETCPALRPSVVVYLHEYKLTRADFLADRRALVDSVEGPASPPGFSPSLANLRQALSERGLHPRQLGERLVGLERLPAGYLAARYVVTDSPEFPPDGPARAAALVRAMARRAASCDARFLMAVLPAPNEAWYGLREPATERLLAALADGTADAGPVAVLDTRSAFPRGSRIALAGLDYPDRDAAARIAQALAQAVAPLLAAP